MLQLQAALGLHTHCESVIHVIHGLWIVEAWSLGQFTSTSSSVVKECCLTSLYCATKAVKCHSQTYGSCEHSGMQVYYNQNYLAAGVMPHTSITGFIQWLK